MYTMFWLMSGAVLCFILYYYQYPFWAALGLRSSLTDSAVLQLYRSGTLSNEFSVRGVCLFFCLLSVIVRSGSSKSYGWPEVAVPLVVGAALFMAGPLIGSPWLFVLVTLSGYALFFVGSLRLGRLYRSFNARLSDYWDTFPQCETLVENPFSVNIPTIYQDKGKKRRGYINVVNPFRATMVIGTPGSGKSYSVYGPFIRQMIQKGYSLFVYDYKYPDLTRLVMNELLDNYGCYGELKPKMYVVNFDNPLYSHRFNPIHPRYLTDPVDATEIAEVIMKNANRENAKGDDFFSLSARCYLDLLIWFLKIYEGGKYCTFPHLVELMGQDYRDVFDVLTKFDELEVKRNTFQDAIKDKAFEQLQGQIASARVPLNRFASKTLYWTLSGDDFSLEMNNPEEPKIICVGNNPRRQSVYGTTLAMLMSQLFKVINMPGKRHSAVLIDELPTIYIKGLDNLINTARSNRVAVVLGAQDKSQLIRDYDKKESDVIFNTVGNVFAGAVKGETAESLSKSFGKAERETRSYQEGDNGDHITYSYQFTDILPAHKIEALSQGSFCGYIADSYEQKIDPKVFCGEIQVGEPPRHDLPLPQIVDMTEREIMEQVELNYKKIHLDVVNLLARELNNPADVEDEEGITPEEESLS